MSRLRIIIFAKAPQAGLVKTRLIPALGAEGAAKLAQRLLQHSLQQALSAKLGDVELCKSPADQQAWAGIPLPNGLIHSDQGSGDLGERMARASARSLQQQQSVLLIGTDCPALDAACLQRAAHSLQHSDAVLVPATDGGYTLLGLNQYHPQIFSDIAWSTATVAAQTQQRIQQLNWSLTQLPSLHDIDEPQDLQHLPADWPEADSQSPLSL